ncbi:MAG: NAD(P)/FAD-dependent oxidoreductase [Alphaproteobacteria bacterium]|nr:NAD(P)/FAD-dependent oxidoreductase [Alphaproteobacteria bacterium]
MAETQTDTSAPTAPGAQPEDGPEVIVIGGGINGLVAAAYLARAGRRVIMVEAGRRIGGMAASSTLVDGPLVSECAHLVSALHAGVVGDLGLHRHGLRYTHRRIPTVLLGHGSSLVLSEDPWEAESAIARLSPQDAPAYRRFVELVRRLNEGLDGVLLSPPPQLGDPGPALNESVRRLSSALRGLPRRDLETLVAHAATPVGEIVARLFHSPLLQGGLAFDGVLGSFAAPSWPGTFLTFLQRRFASVSGRWGAFGHPAGGLGGLCDAVWRAAAVRGARLRLGDRVVRILIEDDRAAGVALESGEEIRAPLVLSTLAPQVTFLELIGRSHLDVAFASDVSRLSARGSVARLTYVLEGLPQLPGSDADGREAGVGRFVVAPDLPYLERAFAAAKFGVAPEEPAVEFTIPSAHDETMLFDGRHVATALAIHAPWREEETVETRRAFADAVEAAITRCVPDFRRRVRKVEVMMPRDIEERYGVPGGHWHHIEMSPDQLWALRPHPRAAAWRAPLGGLYLGGAGSHPFGGVSGLPGRGAALALLQDQGWG